MSAERGRPWWASEPAPSAVSTCGVCPLCTLLRVIGEAHPEVLAHLSEAVRHLSLAVKAVVDAQVAGTGPLERIPVEEG